MRNLLLSLLFIGLYQFASAQPVVEMTLQEAINFALKHDRSIENARLNIEDANAQINERKAIGIPTLNGEADYQYFFEVPTSVLPSQFEEIIKAGNNGQLPEGYTPEAQFGFKNNVNFGLNFNTLLFDGTYFTGLKAARFFKDYVAQQLIATERDVQNKVVEAYIPSLIITENLIVIDKNISTLERLLFGTKETYKAGFAEQLDVDRLELSLANLNVEKENLLRQKELVLNVLKFTINFPLEKELLVKDNLEDLLVEATPKEMTQSVDYYNRPEYKVAVLGEELNRLNIKVYQAGYLPALSGFANYQYGYQGNKLFGDEDGFWVPTSVAGIRLNVPIFDGFDKRSKIQRAQVGLAIAKNQKLELERSINLEVTNARTEYLMAKEKVENQAKTLQLAEKIYKTTQIKFKEGVGTSLELTMAEGDLYQAQQHHIQARYELLVAKTKLDKALGN